MSRFDGDSTITTPYRDSKGRWMKRPSQAQVIQETTSDQRPGNGPQGVWRGIPGQTLDPMAGFGGLSLFGPGGWMMNPMGFPGYGGLYWGNEVTYRWMLQHPVIRLVRSITVGIIAANTWEYEVRNKKLITPDRLTRITQVFNDLRPGLMRDFFVRGRDYGWASGEPIWEYRDNEYVLTRVKPLLNDVTKILRDENGNATGLRNEVSRDGQPFTDIPMPFKAWKFTYDSEAGYVYGRSWLENIRATAWVDWLDAMQQLQKIGSKIAGIVTVITSPSGTFPGPIDPSTNKPTEVSYRDNAVQAIKDLANGAAGVWFPSIGLVPDAKGNVDAMKVMVELVGKSMTSIDTKDFSGNSQAIHPLIERIRHAEENMFAGGLRSPRVGMETQHGQKADAEEHTDTGTLNAEMDDREFALECQPLLDAYMVLNYGERARGAAAIKPPSLVDRKAQVMRAVMLALLNDPTIAKTASLSADIDKIFAALGVPSRQPFAAEKVEKEIEVDQKAKTAKAQRPEGKNYKTQPDPQGGRPEE